MTDPYPNFNDTAVEVWEWILRNFIPHLLGVELHIHDNKMGHMSSAINIPYVILHYRNPYDSLCCFGDQLPRITKNSGSLYR